MLSWEEKKKIPVELDERWLCVCVLASASVYMCVSACVCICVLDGGKRVESMKKTKQRVRYTLENGMKTENARKKRAKRKRILGHSNPARLRKNTPWTNLHYRSAQSTKKRWERLI